MKGWFLHRQITELILSQQHKRRDKTMQIDRISEISRWSDTIFLDSSFENICAHVDCHAGKDNDNYYVDEQLENNRSSHFRRLLRARIWPVGRRVGSE